MRLKAWVGLVAAVVVMGLVGAADATIMVFLTREELVGRSDVIARVRVGKASTREGEAGRLVTRTELEVKQLLKGKAEGRLVLQQWGGRREGKAQRIAGDAVLRSGEDAVVFLRRDEQGIVYLTALSQAAYHVDDRGVARRELEGASLVRYRDGEARPFVPTEQPEPVESLMTDVVRLVRGN